MLGIILRFVEILIAGILSGFIGSLTGLGGGTVLTPLLVLFLGVPIYYATGASLISTIATSSGSASAYIKDKITNVRIGMGLEVATSSGANIGDNTSIQVILSSGTIGAAAQAALIGVPAIAFSAAVSTTGELEAASPFIEPLARTVINYVMRRGMPRGVDVLSINFPSTFSKSTVAKMAEAARFRYEQYLDERVDPRGGKYYWLYGEQRNPKPGTDVYVVNVEKNIAVTPLYLDLNANKCNTHDDLHDLIDAINTAIASWI